MFLSKVTIDFKKISKLRFKKLILWFFIIFISLQILFFIFRNPLINYLTQSKASSFSKNNHAEMHIGKIKFQGVSGIRAENVFLREIGKDTLVKVQSIYARLSFWKLLFFKVSITDFEMFNADLNLVRKDSTDNYSFLLKRKSKEKESIDDEKNYAQRASRLLDLAFNLLPSNVEVKKFKIKANLNDHKISLYLPVFKVEDHQFSSGLTVVEESKLMKWKIEGTLNPGSSEIDCKWYSTDTSKVVLPFLQYKFNTLVAFDTVRFRFYEENGSSSLTRLNGTASVNGLLVNNWRIATTDVILNNASLSYQINIGKNYLELDSTSQAVFNKLVFNPYIRYSPKPDQTLIMKLNKDWFPAQDLFSSLPDGLFYNLNGIEVEGNLSYHFNLDINFNDLNALVFESDLKRDKFRILKPGNTNFSKINEPFMYTAYEHGDPVRTFEVGPGNPNFRTLDEIPEYLKKAVLTSEDGMFFYHRGFIPEAFRSSIIKNIRTKRFARGGSTISMQLVKNVFLNRNKTIARKLEEALIVWLIENNGITTKQRMYEVYLNIIEWGPMIYGANEAAHFYFNKEVSKLTLSEAIYLASIVPHPKTFRYSFDSNGSLKPYLANFYRFVSGKMMKKGFITQLEYDELLPNVELTGPAQKFIMPADSTLSDTTVVINALQEQEELF
jgi:hypothetical protein